MALNDDTSIHVYVEASYDLTVSECWPDNDAPDEITAAAVIGVMKRHGSIRSMLRDWNLEPNEVTVSVNSKTAVWREPT